MKPAIRFILLVIFIGTTLYSCKHESNSGPTRLVDKVAGTYTWHAVYYFGISPSDPITIIGSIAALNDSVLVYNDERNSNIPLTYQSTDSSSGCVTFQMHGAPPVLYYFYKGDSLHFMNHSEGRHLDYQDLYTP